MSHEDEERESVTSNHEGDEYVLTRRSVIVDAVVMFVGGAVGASAIRLQTLQGLRGFILDDGLPANGGQDPQRRALAQAACNPPGSYNQGGGCNPQAGPCQILSVCHEEVCQAVFSCVGGHVCSGEHQCSSDTCVGDFNCGGPAGGVHACHGAHVCSEASFGPCGEFWPCGGFVIQPSDPGFTRARDIRRAIAKKVS
jgi:hypothetical protein